MVIHAKTIKNNYLITASSGFAKANNIATPTPIKNAASIKPAKRNILVWSGSINSGQNFDMAELATIARPYAEALFQSAKPAEFAGCLEQLNELAQLAALPEVAALSNNPKVSADDLSKLLSGLVKTKLDPKVASFLNLVNQNQRLAAVPEIAKQFEAMKNKSEGAAEVMITSAFPLEGSALADLLSSLKKRFGGKELRPTIQVDPALIGGVRIQVGDEVMDGSVRAQLAQMQASLGA